MDRIEKSWQKIPPALRLATAYVAIIMAISIGFSLVLYQVSSHELARQSRRGILLPRYDIELDYNSFRDAQAEEARRHLRGNLVLLNIGTLVVGGALSYYLAKRTLEPIELALEAQTRFAGDASHELRTPLTAIQTEIEVALRDKNLTKEGARRQLESNLEEVAKLKALADSLLRLARTEGGKIQKKPVKLADAYKQAEARVAPAAAAKGIKLSFDGLPLSIRCDREALTELLVILLDNAVKYSDPNTQVVVGATQHGGAAVITVQDQGRGISGVDLPHVFDRFYRADRSRSSDNASGHGLGLAIAKQIVDAHDGTIVADSEVGKGTTITVKLPLSG